METQSPARPGAIGIVERQALLAQLATNASVPVVAVCAGAGYGKTTLATQWAAADPRHHEIVRLAPFLDDPSALALRLVDALNLHGTVAEDIRRVATAAEPAFSALLLPAITKLAASRPYPSVLVVDDIQFLTRPGCHELLNAVIDGLAPGSQVALLGRHETPAWLARTRATGRLYELGASDLALDEDEARQLVANVDPNLSEDQVTDLVTRSEGWAVGLYLMLLAVAAHGRNSRRRAAPVTGSDRYVADYLNSEVLAELPSAGQDFLRRTSILDEVDPALCNAVLERSDCEATLQDIAFQLQLVIQVGPHTYRYHHLLNDALRASLDREEPWLVPDLHRRASQWYQSHGDLDAAIRHAKAGGLIDLAAALIWAGVPACISSGRPDKLGSWLGGLDDSEIRSNGWLILASAWLGLQSGDADRMTRWLLTADEHAGADWQSRIVDDEYAASLAAIHLTVGDGGLQDSIELCRATQLGLPPTSGFRVAAVLNEGVALVLTRRLPEGMSKLQRAEQLSRALGVPVIEANALSWQGLLALLADDLSGAIPPLARVGELVTAHRLDRLATAAPSLSVLALHQATVGCKDQARGTLGVARRLTSSASRLAPWFAVAGPLVQARAAILLGDGAQARTLCAEARSHMIADLASTLLADVLVDTDARLRNLQAQGVSAAAITAAELRVLQFLPTRLTFQQIGEHLFLSQTTVKTHAMSIYRKFGVSARDEAVARAQSLGLVESPPSP